MPSLVLSSVGLIADNLPLPGIYLVSEPRPPMIEEKKQPPPPPPPPPPLLTARKRSLSYLHEDPPAYSSSETSSIGAADEDEDEDGEEVESKEEEDGGGGAFDLLDSLEESLPIKRGLSKFFSGKSKSFANILEIAAATKVNVLAKPENPFNKRQRLARRPTPLLSPNARVEEE